MAGGSIPGNLRPIFQAAGHQYHIPPAVLAGVAAVESSLGANRGPSSAGAVGLMQFLPSTAHGIGINPYDDRQAIFGAAKLLNSYGYQQNPLRAIGAYNGGPGNPQYTYASQVMGEAKRLAPEIAGSGGSMPGFSIPGQPAQSSTLNFRPYTASNTAQAFNSQAFQAAQKATIAGNYLRQNTKSPFDIGPKTGLEGGGSGLAGIFPTTAPNPQDYTSAVKILQQIAGRQVKISSPGTPGLTVQGTPGAQGYVNPIPGANLGRVDMGVDANLPAGHPILAIGDSKVVGISPNWYRGQPFVALQLLSGPAKGRYYYVAEAINPTVRPGQTVRAGQLIGRYNPNGTGLELGWGTSTPGRTLAQATSGYSEGQVTPAGKSFRNFLGSLR